MKAIGYYSPLPISDAQALVETTLPDPKAVGRDLLVAVKAISLNPVDAKQRAKVAPSEGGFKVLGWDASGVVVATGPEVTLFEPGDEVWYAGSIARQGTNAELHLVDERIAALKPKSLGFAQAAALPLTSITAWELLFDRLGVGRGTPDSTLLVVGAAGGVGSILVQLARKLTGMTVIGTASRPETVEWVRSLGAHEVLDHRRPLYAELRRVGHAHVTHVASLTQTDKHYAELIECLAPEGKLGLIDDPVAPLDIMQLKRKSLSLHWELMFTRSLYETPSMIAQHHLLTEVAELVDSGTLRTTVGEHLGVINAANLRRGHALIESGAAKGKIVLEGF